MKSTIQSVEEYLEGYSGMVRKKMEDLRQAILLADPDITEKIAWGAPTYYRKKYLVHFPIDQDIPAGLVRKMVLYRIREISDEKN